MWSDTMYEIDMMNWFDCSCVYSRASDVESLSYKTILQGLGSEVQDTVWFGWVVARANLNIE